MIKGKIEAQHQEIKQALKELREDVYSVKDISENALWIALKIGHLNGILHMHLKFEDDYLYPCLTNCSCAEAQAVSERFNTLMGALAAKFDDYIHKYIGNPNSIKEKTEEFAEESRQLIDQIWNRIEIEEKELYELVEKSACNRPQEIKS